MLQSRRLFGAALLLTLSLWTFVQWRALVSRIDSGRHVLALDFAYYIQVFEGILAHGRSGSAIVGSDSIFSVHFSPAVYPLSLLYGLLREVSSAQLAAGFLGIIAVVSASLLVSWRQRRPLRGGWSPAFAALALLLLNSQATFLALQGPREAVLAAPVVALLCIAFAADRVALVCLLAAALLAFREDYILIVLGYALFAGIRRNAKMAGLLFAVSVIGGGFALGVHLTSASASITGLIRFRHLGETPLLIALSPLLRPETFFGHLFREETGRFAVQLVAAFAFLPLFGVRHLLPFVPYFLMLSLNGHEMLTVQSVDAYYAAPFFAPLLMAALEGLDRLNSWLRAAHPILSAILLSLVVLQLASSSAFAAALFPSQAERSLSAQFETIREWQHTTGVTDIAAPGAYLPYLADLPGTKALAREGNDARFVVTPTSLQRIDALPELMSPAEYQDWLPLLLREGKVVMATADVYVIDRGSPAYLPLSNPFDGGVEVQAEYCSAEHPYDRIQRRSGEREVRLIGARSGFGLLPGPRSAAVICGPFQFGRPVAIEVVARQSVAERCSSRRQPPRFALRLENGAIVERPWPETADDFRSSRLEFPETAGRPFTILIQSRGCGEYELDLIRIEEE